MLHLLRLIPYQNSQKILQLIKVKEYTTLSNENTIVYSSIYVENKDMSYSLDYSTITNVSNDNVKVTETKNNITKTYISLIVIYLIL